MTTFDQHDQAVQTQTNVAGDQIFSGPTYIYEAPSPLLPPAASRERRGLGILLDKVKTFWIEGVLDKSIHTTVLLDLGKQLDFAAIEHPWERVLELPDQDSQQLPRETNIRTIFDTLNRAMLILGEPGSGKTMTLLELARELIAVAEADQNFTQPVPVVFNLSSWTRGQALLEWLVSELSAKYQIAGDVGRIWLQQYRVLPLLDGLDEVKADHRAACVEAINAFGSQIGLAGLVVCSRRQEYTALPVRLRLNGAVRLETLTPQQIEDYIDRAGPKLAGLRQALDQDQPLQALAQSPLMLTIMSLTYQDSPAQADQPVQTVEARRRHLFEAYIRQMFRRKGKGPKPYPDEQTTTWLAWLARQMTAHNQTVFLIEQMQPSWLATPSLRWSYLLISRLLGGLIGGIAIGLIFFGFARGIVVGLRTELIFGFIAILLTLLLFGVGVGIYDGWRYNEKSGFNLTRRWPEVWATFAGALILSLVLSSIFWLYFRLIIALLLGLILCFLIIAMDIVWIFGGRGGRQNLVGDIQSVEALNWSWSRAFKGGGYVILVWLILGIFYKLITSVSLSSSLWVLRPTGLVILIIGLLFSGPSPSIIRLKTKPNQGMRLSLRNGVVFGILYALVIGASAAFILWWYDWATFIPWLNSNPTGLEVGPLVGLSGGLLAFLWWGGFEIIQHFTLRGLLYLQGYLPWHYSHFLNHATERTFLQRVGGGYIFAHRLLLEHFAKLTPTSVSDVSSVERKAVLKWFSGGLVSVVAIGCLTAYYTFPQALYYAQRGEFFRIQGRDDLALAAYSQAIQITPYPFYLVERAFLYARSGKLESGIDDLNQVIEQVPEDAYSYKIRGVFYGESGNWNQARLDYEKSFDLDPEHSNARFYLCWHGSLLDSPADFIEYCNQAIDTWPFVGLYYDGRGRARALTGDYAGAIEDFQFFLDWSEEISRFDSWRPQREAWIAELEAGRNPFDEATLKSLLGDLVER